MISIFSPDDHEMMEAKTDPKWFELTPWRARANNSAAFVKGHVNEERFREIFRMAREFGEPGFVFLADPDYGINPCGEIGLNPVLQETGETGWAFCNLTEINGATCVDREDFLRRAVLAARIGTLQATYTYFPYLGSVSEKIAVQESLLGVGITGMMDNPDLCLDSELLRAAAAVVGAENQSVAKVLEMPVAARTTCVKPSGTSSLALGAIGSGIHLHHARKYFRRIMANPNEEIFQRFREANPHMCYELPTGDWIVTFPVKAPDGALVLKDRTAVEFMGDVFGVYRDWVATGTIREDVSPGLTNNVSATIVVRDDEWEAVEELAWQNRGAIGAMSFLPWAGDKIYPNAPREAVVTEEDETKWKRLARDYRPPQYDDVETDSDPLSTAACESDKCEFSPEGRARP